MVGLGHLLHQGFLDIGVHVGPSINYLIVTFLVGDETHVVVHRNLLYFLVTSFHDIGLLCGDDDITQVERKTTLVCLAVTKILNTIEEVACASHTYSLDNLGDNVAE